MSPFSLYCQSDWSVTSVCSLEATPTRLLWTLAGWYKALEGVSTHTRFSEGAHTMKWRLETQTMWVASFHSTMYFSFESLYTASNCVDFPPMSPQDSWFAQRGYWDVFLRVCAEDNGHRWVSTPGQVEKSGLDNYPLSFKELSLPWWITEVWIYLENLLGFLASLTKLDPCGDF